MQFPVSAEQHVLEDFNVPEGGRISHHVLSHYGPNFPAASGRKTGCNVIPLAACAPSIYIH